MNWSNVKFNFKIKHINVVSTVFQCKYWNMMVKILCQLLFFIADKTDNSHARSGVLLLKKNTGHHNKNVKIFGERSYKISIYCRDFIFWKLNFNYFQPSFFPEPFSQPSIYFWKQWIKNNENNQTLLHRIQICQPW